MKQRKHPALPEKINIYQWVEKGERDDKPEFRTY